MPELVLRLGDNVLQNYAFDKDVMSIGRSRDNDVVVENLSVSRNHARIRRQNGKYILTDLNSANGTFVNGVRVSKTEIVHGDLVSVGKHKLQFCDAPVDDALPLAGNSTAASTVIVERTTVPVLCISEGKLKGQEFPLTKFETSIGKAPSNDIVLGDDWFLAKKQAVFVRRGNAEYELHDMGGFRKTKINSEEVKDSVLLKPGDVIEFGNTRCVFQLASGQSEQVGRVPHEMALENSIFPQSERYQELVPVASEEDFHRETPFADNNPAGHDPEQSDAEVAFSGMDVAGLVRHALEESPVGSSSQDGQDKSAIFSMNPDTSEPELLLVQPGDMERRWPDQHEVAARPQEEEGEAVEEMPAASGAPGAEEELLVAAAATEREAGAEQNGHELPAVGDESEPALAMASSAQPGTPSPTATGGRLSRKRRRDQQRQKNSDNRAGDEAPTSPRATEDSAPTSGENTSAAQGAQQENAAPATEHTGSDAEIALWEAAMQNRSPVIRRQAARMLKKLTGRDYDV